MFRIRSKRCDQCLLSDNKIVSDKRRNEVLRECVKNDTHFICHKHHDVCCRGFYDQDPGASNLMRIAGRLGCVQFVETDNG